MWFIDNRLVAFNLCLTSGDILIGEYVGFDYSLAHEHHLYFVRSRDVTTYCIENGIKKYYTGATDYEPKKRLGSKIIPLYTYVKHRNRLLNPILKIVCKFLSPHDFDKNLKSSAKEDY
jgi:predicted N-acyltransferase